MRKRTFMSIIVGLLVCPVGGQTANEDWSALCFGAEGEATLGPAWRPSASTELLLLGRWYEQRAKETILIGFGGLRDVEPEWLQALGLSVIDEKLGARLAFGALAGFETRQHSFLFAPVVRASFFADGPVRPILWYEYATFRGQMDQWPGFNDGHHLSFGLAIKLR